VIIRPITDADAAGFHAALDVVARERKYLLMTEAPPLASTQAFVGDNIRKGMPQFVVLDGDRVVGWCDILPGGWASLAHVGTVGMGLLPSHRGRRIGEDLLRCTLDAGRAFGLKKAKLGVFATNTRATALYRKVGFVEEGLCRQAICIDGVYFDEILMGLLFE
jgi:RimJ/RimL family protein N-acetyltransferase